MDRLIVGDVGFGKTEIAIRAARHVAAHGKQVALLAPTTLLVQQHTDTLRSRLPTLASSIVTLSRFSTPAEQRTARAAIAQGTALIAVGTHALLSAATTWKDLGLVIIDEEQRFGVKHKEHFKKIRAVVDMLSLSATPIPRTLSMALQQVKQLSVISTAPEGRQSVQTIIGQDSDDMLRKALEDELGRKGQVYVVSPRIRGLHTLARRVASLSPGVRVAVAHGQLPSAELAAIMERFDAGDLDVLVSSTIVENGLDLPNANTMIVTRATHFGLSDLYQLRGRVGRRTRQGRAYFLYSQSELTSLQRQRLTALTEASRLGSGWALAQRDLEIRGAGNLLGAEQSGTVSAVGLQLYLDLISEATQQESTAHGLRRRDVDIRLPLPASIPSHYIADAEVRTKWYQTLGRSPTPVNLRQQWKTMIDTYGPPPPEANNLLLLLELQHAAAHLGVSMIAYKMIAPSDESPYPRMRVKAQDPVAILKRLGHLGAWQVRDHELTWDVNEITPKLVELITAALQ